MFVSVLGMPKVVAKVASEGVTAGGSKHKYLPFTHANRAAVVAE